MGNKSPTKQAPPPPPIPKAKSAYVYDPAADNAHKTANLADLEKYNINLRPQQKRSVAVNSRLLVVCSNHHSQFILYSLKRGNSSYVAPTDSVASDPVSLEQANTAAPIICSNIDFIQGNNFATKYKGNEDLLEQYDCMLFDVFCNSVTELPYVCAVLVEFSASGRGLVVCGATNCSKYSQHALIHSFEALEFHPLLYSTQYFNSRVEKPFCIGTIHEPTHPLMSGVHSKGFESSNQPEYTKCAGVHPKATRVADWDCGEVLVAYKMNPPGTGMVVALNFGAPCKSTYWNNVLDGGHRIIANAVRFAVNYDLKRSRAMKERLVQIQQRTAYCDIVIITHTSLALSSAASAAQDSDSSFASSSLLSQVQL